MFGLSFSEILVILVAALIIFGPDRLPEVAQQLGRNLGRLRRGMDEVKKDLALSDLETFSKAHSQAAKIIRNPQLLASNILDSDEQSTQTK
jgi:TatA/E family protein of Tat protein translocase